MLCPGCMFEPPGADPLAGVLCAEHFIHRAARPLLLVRTNYGGRVPEMQMGPSSSRGLLLCCSGFVPRYDVELRTSYRYGGMHTQQVLMRSLLLLGPLLLLLLLLLAAAAAGCCCCCEMLRGLCAAATL